MVDNELPFTEYFLSGMLRSRPNFWSRFGGIDKRKSLDQEYDLGQKEGKLPHLLICLKENSFARNRVRVDAPVRPASSG